MQSSITTWLAYVHDHKDQGSGYAYEVKLRQLVRARKEKEAPPQLLLRVKALEQMTLLGQLPSSQRQQARFFYQAGCIYSDLGQFSLAHEAFTLCQRRIKAHDFKELYHLHLEWAKVTDALRFYMYAYRSYSLVVTLTEQQHLPHGQHYRKAQQRCHALFAVLTQ